MKFERKKSKQKKTNKKKTIFMALIILAAILLTGFVFVSTGLVSLSNQGYNYKAHSYKGLLCDYDPESVICGRYPNIKISAKWNEAYMSSSNESGEYERHAGFDSYIGSGAKVSKLIHGNYFDEELNQTCKKNTKLEFLAAPESATLDNGVWYNEAGEEIGRTLDEEGMMLVSRVNNDYCVQQSGSIYNPNAN